MITARALRTLRRRHGAAAARHANRAGLPRRPLAPWPDTRDVPAAAMRWEDRGTPAAVLTGEQVAELRARMRTGMRDELLAAHIRRMAARVRQLLVDAIRRELVRR